MSAVSSRFRSRAIQGMAVAIPLALLTGVTAAPSSAQTYDPVPDPIGAWRFDGDGFDDSGSGADLTAAAGLSYSADRSGRPEAALSVDATADRCAATGGPVADTTNSFTITAWVLPDGLTGADQTVLAQSGGQGPAFTLGWDAETDAWTFADAHADSATAAWDTASSTTPPTVGEWQHLTAVVDLPADSLRLYVDGVQAASTRLNSNPWKSNGAFAIGCTHPESAAPAAFDGAIDDVTVSKGVFTDARIAELAAGDHFPAAAQAWWPLRGDGLDRSGRAAELTGAPAAGDDWVADQYGRAASALALDGTTCLTAADAEVRTDASFTASVWTRLDAASAGDSPTVLNFRGDAGRTVRLKYNATNDRWQFVLAESGGADAARTVVSADAGAIEEWTQLTAVYDADRSTARLYVNGTLAAEAALEHAVGRADELAVGCARETRTGIKSPWHGAISQIRLWRGVADAEQIADSRVDRVSFWELEEADNGTDFWGPNDLTFNGTPTWGIDRYNQCAATLKVDADAPVYGTTTDVVRTDESFTVIAWARLDDLNGRYTVLSQTAANGPSFDLAYDSAAAAWTLAMREVDTADAATGSVAGGAVTAERWYHLAATYDLATGTMSLYVDGVLAGTAAGPTAPWHADGSFLIGAAGDNAGNTQAHFNGDLDQIKVYDGVLDTASITTVARQRPGHYAEDPANAYCGGDEGPPVID